MATKKISAMTALSGVAGSADLLHVVQSGANFKATPSQLGMMYWRAVTTTDTCVAGEALLLDPETTGSFVQSLPASPVAGEQVYLYLASKSTAGRYVDIDPGAKAINGSTDDIRLTIQDWYLWLRYDGTEWKIIVDGRKSRLAEFTLSSDGSVEFADDFTPFDAIDIKLTQYLPSVNNAQVYIRYSTDMGATYKASTEYAWAYHLSTYATGSRGGGGSQAQGEFMPPCYGVGTLGRNKAHTRVFLPRDAAEMGGYDGGATFLNSGGSYYRASVGGLWSTGIVEGFKILPNTGVMSSGYLTFDGVLKK